MDLPLRSTDPSATGRAKGLSDHGLSALWIARAPETAMTGTIAYPGPLGSHSGAAAAKLHPGSELVPLRGFRAVADAVVHADFSRGVLPIESSLAGAVTETHDLLHERALSIVAEAILPVRHRLVGPQQVPLSEIRFIRSHPSALEQCRELFIRLPHARPLASATTAEAALETATRADPHVAAIASSEAAFLYGLVTLLDDVGDGSAFTRFVSVAPHTWLGANRSTARTALTFVTAHRPGALYEALEPFARAGLDLVQLVSRPLTATPFSYRFDAVIAGHPLDTAVRQAIADLAEVTRSRRVLGVYESAAQP